MHLIALIFTLPFIALALVGPASVLMPLVYTSLAFPGSSVLELGPVFFGIYQCVILSIIVGVCLRLFGRGLELKAGSVGFMLPYLALFGWSVVATVIGPRIFAGAIYTVNAYSNDPAPLVGGTYNVVQLFAFMLQITMLVLVFTQAPKINAASLDKWIKIGILLIAVLTLMQLVGGPYKFLSTNVFHNKTRGFFGVQEAADFTRLSGPFSEPSALASWFTAGLAYLVGSWNNRLTHQLLAALCVFVLVISTASTSFVGLAIVALMFMAITGRGIASMIGAALLLVTLAIVGFFVFDLVYQGAAQEILNRVLFEKGESDSFATRMALNVMAVSIFFQSYGIGVGLGSHRPSSEICMIISNVGVIGLVLYLVIIVRRLLIPWLRLLMIRRQGGHDRNTEVAMGLMCMAVVGVLIATALGGDMSTSSVHRIMLYGFLAYQLTPAVFRSNRGGTLAWPGSPGPLMRGQMTGSVPRLAPAALNVPRPRDRRDLDGFER